MTDAMCPQTSWMDERFTIIARSRAWSAEEAAACAVPAADALSRAGVQPGDVVALTMPTGAESLFALRALDMLRAVALPLSPRLPAADIEQRLDLTRCRAVLQSLAPPRVEMRNEPAGLLSSAVDSPSSDNRPALIVFTSGSMGLPRPAVLTAGNLRHSALNANSALRFRGGDSWALSLGLDHVAGHGVLWRAMTAGGSVLVPEFEEPLEDFLLRSAPTHLSLVPTQLFRMMNHGKAVEALRAARCILMGGGPMADSLVRDAVDTGLPIATSYGMTETAGLMCASPPRTPLDDLLTSGRPLTPETIRTASDGEILVRGATVFAGYLDVRSALHRPAVDGDWFATGDLGRFDEAGRLHVEGRKDNRFKCGGENIQPEAIERAMAALPGVVEAIVVPVADHEYGHIPVAFVRLREDHESAENAWRQALAQTLPRFMVPRRFFDWPHTWGRPPLKSDRAAMTRLAGALVAGNPPSRL